MFNILVVFLSVQYLLQHPRIIKIIIVVTLILFFVINIYNLLSLLDDLGCLDNHEVPDEVLGHVALTAVVEKGEL